MVFKPAPNIKGRIFIPEEETPTRKKHTCPDCYTCQMCGEERCRVCRSETGDRPCALLRENKKEGTATRE